MIRIVDPDDPRIAIYRNVRDRDLQGRAGCFLAEGEVVLRVLLSGASRFRAASVLLSDTRADALAAWLAATAPDLPAFVADDGLLEAIAGFPIHRGVLAAGLRQDARDADAVLAAPEGAAVALGLVGIANHDNTGGLFRNAAAFGASAVLLDNACCDPLYRKAIRVSVGACLTVPFAKGGSPGEIVARLRWAEFEVFALSPSGREELGTFAWPARTALLVGAEGAGLPTDILARVRTVAIRMANGFDSLNVATASGIALHSITRP